MAGSTDKDAIRTSLLSLRLNHDEQYIVENSARIAHAIKALDLLGNGRAFGLYASVKNEVRTAEIIDRLVADGKKVYLPSIVDDRIVFARFTGWSETRPGRYTIPEPTCDERIDAASLDAIFVPGVAFTEHKYRIGFGKGFYDRLLADYRGGKIGLAFDFQIVEGFTPDDHDIPMDIIGTPSRIIR